ncbi:MAG: tRNA (adenosine(37)-N6)-threonylcarbamoyltransferase complex dimerization subunit type 1 TsaB [Gammaproteobacteria bacterium]|nr:tRNA (adenosine(37)-N6)-threonylcarbamoyltransferase complex dimerization subunit type 1 TsaB [Gammaproteobacteria bacterium]
MVILALETSTEACSVALSTTDQELFSDFELTPRQHTRYLPIMLESVLQRAGLVRKDIELIAFGSGPGAFTGVRIAASTAQGLAIGLKVPLLGVSSLAALAQQAYDELSVTEIVAALDARMGEAYLGHYHINQASQLVELEGVESLRKLQDLLPLNNTLSAGSGWAAWQQQTGRDSIDYPVYPEIYPTAAAVVKLARSQSWQKLSTSPDKIKINYIRDKVAEKKLISR